MGLGRIGEITIVYQNGKTITYVDYCEEDYRKLKQSVGKRKKITINQIFHGERMKRVQYTIDCSTVKSVSFKS